MALGQAQGLVCTPLSIVDPTFEQECFAEPTTTRARSRASIEAS